MALSALDDKSTTPQEDELALIDGVSATLIRDYDATELNVSERQMLVSRYPRKKGDG